MNEYTKILCVIAFVILYGCVVVGAGAVDKEKPSKNIVALPTEQMLIVSKDAIYELVQRLTKEGDQLKIAVYEYDKQREVWDRASLGCIEQQRQ